MGQGKTHNSVGDAVSFYIQYLYQCFRNGQTVPAVLQLMEWRVSSIMATEPSTLANRSATVRFLSSHGSTHNKGELKTTESRKRKFSCRIYELCGWITDVHCTLCSTQVMVWCCMCVCFILFTEMGIENKNSGGGLRLRASLKPPLHPLFSHFNSVSAFTRS